MNKNNFPSFKFFGNICNVLSCLLTIILCLPIPILLFFLLKRMTKLFSIYGSYTDFIEGKVELDKLRKKLVNTKIALVVFAGIWLIITVLVYENTDVSKMDNALGNLIVILPIVLTLPCIILCSKVNSLIK